jgi:hypothetical protein
MMAVLEHWAALPGLWGTQMQECASMPNVWQVVGKASWPEGWVAQLPDSCEATELT